jgi:hypothetical protein
MSDPHFPGLDIRVIEDRDISADLDQAIRSTLVTCFPHHEKIYSKTRRNYTPLAWTVVAVADDGSAASLISVAERRMLLPESGGSLWTAGIGTVSALPKYRKTGLIGHIMALVLEEADRRGYDIGMLFCKPPLVPVYSRMGWSVHEPPVTIIGTDGTPKVKNPTGEHFAMTRPLKIDPVPSEPVDAAGPDW